MCHAWPCCDRPPYTVRRYEPDGRTAWVRNFGDPIDRTVTPDGCAVDSAGRVYVIGPRVEGDGVSFNLRAYDRDGTALWVHDTDTWRHSGEQADPNFRVFNLQIKISGEDEIIVLCRQHFGTPGPVSLMNLVLWFYPDGSLKRRAVNLPEPVLVDGDNLIARIDVTRSGSFFGYPVAFDVTGLNDVAFLDDGPEGEIVFASQNWLPTGPFGQAEFIGGNTIGKSHYVLTGTGSIESPTLTPIAGRTTRNVPWGPDVDHFELVQRIAADGQRRFTCTGGLFWAGGSYYSMAQLNGSDLTTRWVSPGNWRGPLDANWSTGRIAALMTGHYDAPFGPKRLPSLACLSADGGLLWSHYHGNWQEVAIGEDGTVATIGVPRAFGFEEWDYLESLTEN